MDERSPNLRDKLMSVLPVFVTGTGVITLLGAAGILAWHVFGMDGEGNETLRFIALIIVFMAALAATAALFVALRLGNPGEAFGLPAGSIRALIAVGIMILFVVFGMPVLTPMSDSSIERINARVPQAELSQTIRSYRDQGFLVAVIDPGTPDTRNAAGQAVPGTVAQLKIVGRLPSRSPDQVDLTKQLLTAIITLLTTVIGFYFGSRSSTEAMREASGARERTPIENPSRPA